MEHCIDLLLVTGLVHHHDTLYYSLDSVAFIIVLITIRPLLQRACRVTSRILNWFGFHSSYGAGPGYLTYYAVWKIYCGSFFQVLHILIALGFLCSTLAPEIASVVDATRTSDDDDDDEYDELRIHRLKGGFHGSAHVSK